MILLCVLYRIKKMLKVKNFMSFLLLDKNKINMGDNVKFVNEFVNFVFNGIEYVEFNVGG